MASLKKSLEEETVNHEASVAEMRHKHVQELNGINEQLENLRKAKAVLEKAKGTLEAENADLATELRSVNSSRQENDRRRKQAESQIAELQVSSSIRMNIGTNREHEKGGEKGCEIGEYQTIFFVYY